jgi:hypothetical protein
MVHLEYPNHEFSLIMGKDNLTSLSKCFEVILQNHAIYVYPRIEAKDRTGEVLSSESESRDLKNHPKVHLIDAPIVEIFTFIRKSIKGKNIQPLLPTKVWEYIDHNNLQEIITPVQFYFSFYLLKSAGKIVILPDNRKTSVCGICLLSQTIFSFFLNKWLGITIQTTTTFFESASSISYSDGIIKLGIIEGLFLLKT